MTTLDSKDGHYRAMNVSDVTVHKTKLSVNYPYVFNSWSELRNKHCKDSFTERLVFVQDVIDIQDAVLTVYALLYSVTQCISAVIDMIRMYPL